MGSPQPLGDRLSVRVVGRFGVLRGGREIDEQAVGTRKARLLLKVLAVRSPQAVSTDELTEAVWPGEPPRRPTDNLATLVSRLRRVLGPAVIEGDRALWRLGDDVGTDLRAAAELVGESERRSRADEPALALTAAGAALELLGDGRLLTEEPLGDWAEAGRADALRLVRDARHLTARAALAIGDLAAAVRAAEQAVGADPFDEEAVRLLMRAQAAAGSPGLGLAAYEGLRASLSEELGTDPAPETRAVHLDLLTEQSPVPDPSDRRRQPRRAPERSVGRAGAGAFVGRDVELATVDAAWREAVDGRPALLLIVGEPGIGKSRLAGELVATAQSSGGQVLEARCYGAERSLFLQPFVDAVRPEVVRSAPAVLRELAGDRAPTLASLVPEVADVLGPLPRDPATADTERRLAYEALIGFLRRLAARRPLLLVLDDAQNAGLATVELLHLLARRAAGARLLVVATVRSDSGAPLLGTLRPVATRIELGPLDEAGVLELAAAHGRGEDAASLLARTRGHPLFVVESLRALESGEAGVPLSLAVTVDQQVDALGPELGRTLRAASVLGTTFDPATLAALLAVDRLSVVEDCERLAAARLLVAAGSTYEFSNDLIQEIVHAGTAQPLRETYHLRAAGLFHDRPEAAGAHAEAGGQWPLAADSWLSAGLEAAQRFALADGEQLLSRGVAAADRTGDPRRRTVARLERGRLRLVLGDFPGSLDDSTTALGLAREHGLRDLELLLDREMGGDVLIAMGRPVSACVPYLEQGLVIARELDDGVREADLLARSAVLTCNRLQFVPALADSTRAVEIARRTGQPEALLLALDGLKTCYAYLGDLEALTTVTDELEPLCRWVGPVLQLQWSVFERSFVPMAAGDWEAAAALVEEALALSRRAGWTTFEGWFLAHLGWLARLAGRLDEAVEHGRRAVAVETGRDHPWWRATACAMLAGSLRARDPDDREVVRILRQGLVSADRTGAEGFRLRCLAGLADATGAPDARDQAQLLLDGLRVPAGRHWMHGTDAILGLGRAWLDAGRPDRALAVVEPLHTVGTATGWGVFLTASGVDDLLLAARGAAGVPGQRRSTSRAAIRSAPPGATGR